MGDAPKPTKATGKPRRSSTGGPGPRNVDMTNWRTKLQASRLKFDDDAKDRFLEHFARTGLFCRSAQAVDCSPLTVRKHIENDPDFAEAFQVAKDTYRDRIVDHAITLATEGSKEPIIGGKDKDQVIDYKIVYPIQLIAMELRRVEPEYKERQEIDLNTNGGGVLVAPAGKTPEQWIAEQEAANKAKEAPPEMSD